VLTYLEVKTLYIKGVTPKEEGDPGDD